MAVMSQEKGGGLRRTALTVALGTQQDAKHDCENVQIARAQLANTIDDRVAELGRIWTATPPTVRPHVRPRSRRAAGAQPAASQDSSVSYQDPSHDMGGALQMMGETCM